MVARLVLDPDAEPLDRGVRGPPPYGLSLPARITGDRKPDYGAIYYVIHMRAATHLNESSSSGSAHGLDGTVMPNCVRRTPAVFLTRCGHSRSSYPAIVR
jgi:hypothetical protein